MAIEVEGPGGVIVEFPDGTSAETIQGAMRKQFPPTSGGAPAAPSGPAPGLLESFGRGLLSGGTLGFENEIGLADAERQEASRKANPWTHFAGEVVGTLAPALAAAPVAAGRLGASAVARGAQALARPFAAGDISTLPRAIGQGAKLGASYGAVSGVGHADEGLGNRIWGGVTGGVTGAALGAGGGAVTYPLSRAIAGIGAARAAAGQETADAGAGALTAFSRALERDRIGAQDLIGAITADLPTSRAAALRAPGAMERLIQRMNEGATQADLAREFGIAPSTVRRIQQVAEENLATPLNLVDRAKLMRAGAGENTGWTLRAVSATPGEARSVARERLVERQVGQGERLSDAITRYIGTPDFETRSAQLAREVADRNAQLYDAAHQLDAQLVAYGRTVGDAVQPVLDAHALQWTFSRGPVATAIREAIEAFRPAQLRPGQPPIDRPMGSLQEFMQAKQELQALFDRYRDNKTVMRALTRFRDDLYDAVGRHNPEWRVANDAAADGFAAQRALNLGMEYAGRLGAQTRDQLTRFRAMSPEEQELYRIGVAQRLNDRLMNRAETHDLTSELRLPGARQTLRVILGEKNANAFFRRVDREFATTRTYREQFGSQTTPLREAMDELNWAPQMQSAWDLLSPRRIAEQAAAWAARNFNERRNNQLLEMLTNTDPIRQLEILRAVRPVQQAQTAWGRNAGVPAVNFTPAVTNALMGEFGQMQRDYRRAAVR